MTIWAYLTLVLNRLQEDKTNAIKAIKAMSPFLHAICCACKLFWVCYESNCLKGESYNVGDVRDVDQMR